MTFCVRQKVQISAKILPQIPSFASFFSPSENEALSAVYNWDLLTWMLRVS